MIFQTPRLDIKKLTEKDFLFYTELVSDPEIINPVPQQKWSEEEISNRFERFTNYDSDNNETIVLGAFEKGKDELIGLCALLTNDENEREIGYRFRKKYWGQGYATEMTKYFIEYCFKELNLEIITADVNIKNIASVKVLEKFFHPRKEFINEKDNCTDRRYFLKKSDW